VRGRERAGAEGAGTELTGTEGAGPQATAGPAPVTSAQQVPPAHQGDQPAGSLASQLIGPAVGWLSIFVVSFGLFVLRFLVPVPVGMANDGDGARLMCGFGVQPVTGGYPPLDKYAFFRFHSAASCAREHLYPSSQHILLLGAQWLTPVLGLPGRINLIALGLVTSAVASFGIASLVMGLRLNLWARLALAAALWLIMADAAFFDAFVSPLSEGATLTGLLLIAAGLVYLGRSWPATAFGLLLTGAGSYLAILSKEQYLPMALPVFLAMLLASARPEDRRRLRRFFTLRTAAAAAVIAVLATTAGFYVSWIATSPFAAALHREQAVDMTFAGIVTGHDNVRADLHALGLPASWAKYAGTNYWTKVGGVRQDPLYAKYAPKITDANIAHFLLTHPSRIISVAQYEATQALHVRVTYLGSYAPSAGHPPGALEYRVALVSRLEGAIGSRLGLWYLVPLWIVMAGIAIAALRRQHRKPWRREGAVLVLCLTGCAFMAFIPPGFFEGTAVTRHMLGMNLANLLPIPVAVALAISLLRQALQRRRAPGPQVPGPEALVPEALGPEAPGPEAPGHQALDPQAPGQAPGQLEVPSS
jgi:hypothetical protein